MELDLKLTSKDINEIMWSCGKTLSTAESCTAGRISAAITAVPGSSDYFKGHFYYFYIVVFFNKMDLNLGFYVQ